MKMKEIDVLLIGTPNLDIVVGNYEEMPKPGQEVRVDSMTLTGGGGCFITSVALARLGLSTSILCSLGNDFFAQFLQKELLEEGVQIINKSSVKNTGISIALDVQKDRRFITYDGSVNDITPVDANKDLLLRTRHVHLSNFKGIEDFEAYSQFIDKAHDAGATVSLDMSWDDTGQWDSCALALCKKLDLFFANETEMCHYMRQENIEKVLENLGDIKTTVAIKLGSKGSVGINGRKIYRTNPIPIVAADTTGAGDSFNAGFLMGFLQKQHLATCLQMGNVCGALSVMGVGGCPTGFTEENFKKMLFENYP